MAIVVAPCQRSFAAAPVCDLRRLAPSARALSPSDRLIADYLTASSISLKIFSMPHGRRSQSPALSAASHQIAAVRGFNRFYTGQLGLLRTDYLRKGWTLAAVRVLYEIANRRKVTARSIGRELRLDEAYLSRILATFEQRGLILRTVCASDARQRTLALTSRGRRTFGELDQAAAARVTESLGSLTQDDRHRLIESMARIQQLLDHTRPSAEVRLRTLEVGDIGWIIHRQAQLYAAEYGWDITYEGLIAEILGEFVKRRRASTDAAWIGELGSGIVGSVFLVRADEKIAKLRLLYVEPSARGLGIGRRLVEQCVRGAQERGYEMLTLWTNDVLVSARRIYEAAGFQLVSEERHKSFGKKLVGQTWQLSLLDGAVRST
jgi:DNA-binding MarR family transcriptional regulator/N-acetylglutamate synthase-like GNAT family acetyltransferase